MYTMMDRISDEVIAERLDRLEEECRGLARERLKWKRIGTAASLVGCILLLSGAAQSGIPKEIAAESFILKDAQGRTIAVLGQWGRERAVRLRFMSEQGGASLDVGTELGEGKIRFQGANRRPTLMLQGSPGLGGSLSIYDRDHKLVFEAPQADGPPARQPAAPDSPKP
jgi:hypothetical protein